MVEKAVLEVNLSKLMVFLFRDTLRHSLRYQIHLYRTKVSFFVFRSFNV
jgi:hypothetical protein